MDTNPFAFTLKSPDPGKGLSDALGISEVRSNKLIGLVARQAMASDKVSDGLAALSQHAETPAELSYMAYSFSIIAGQLNKIRAANPDAQLVMMETPEGQCNCPRCQARRLQQELKVPMGPAAEA